MQFHKLNVGMFNVNEKVILNGFVNMEEKFYLYLSSRIFSITSVSEIVVTHMFDLDFGKLLGNSKFDPNIF